VSFESLSPDQIRALRAEQAAAYDQLKAAGLQLDLTRGKPAPEQLDLANGLLDLPSGFRAADGTDTRNYGGLYGLPEIRSIWAEILGVPIGQVLAQDNASLAVMHDVMTFALLHGVPGSAAPWSGQPVVKWICAVPGYDRHFTICEKLGIEMVTVDYLDDGPDMAAVRELVEDPAVKGMWLVPTYSNPTGITISAHVAAELAAMNTAAPDFRIMWDNAYAVHHLSDEQVESADIMGLCAASGHPDRAFVFASTSKITFAGSGVSFIASSSANIDWYLSYVMARTIGPDKVNHLRHAEFLKDADGVHALMDEHRAILAPKFAAVLEVLDRRLGDHGVATWTEPKGGYFVSLDVADGQASQVVQLAKDAGIALTPAGASFPYGKDPRNRNIRLAPSFASVPEIVSAMEGVATCVLLAASETALG
jgi:DNA-binding transcriptional MocR family regulator